MASMKPITLTQPADWIDAFKQEAAKQGTSLSEWMGERCKAALPANVSESLSDRVGRGRPNEKETNDEDQSN